MSRKPVSHSRPAALVSHLWGCVIAKPGRPPKDRPEVIQQVVNLVDANPLKSGQAAKQVAQEIGGVDWRRMWERLRRRYRTLKNRGLLPRPQPQTADALQEKIAADFREVYRRDAANRQAIAEKRLRKEKEAESLGLQLGGQNIDDLLQAFEKDRTRIGHIIHRPTDQAAYYYKLEGIEVEDAIARHINYCNEYKILEKKISILREIQVLL
jgi:hypothetical protein